MTHHCPDRPIPYTSVTEATFSAVSCDGCKLGYYVATPAFRTFFMAIVKGTHCLLWDVFCQKLEANLASGKNIVNHSYVF